jgi:hypothetical protein
MEQPDLNILWIWILAKRGVPLPLLWGINIDMKPLSGYSVISTDVGRDAGREVAG